MKTKQSIMFGMIGAILNLINLRYILAIFGLGQAIQGASKYLWILSLTKSIIAYIFLIIFFSNFFIRGQSRNNFRRVGVIAVASIGINLFSVIADTIITRIILFVAVRPSENISMFNALTVINFIFTVLNFIAAILFIISLSIYYLDLAKEDKIKKYVFLVLICQSIVTGYSIILTAFGGILLPRYVKIGSTKLVDWINGISSILGIISLAVFVIYFIKLYTLNKNEPDYITEVH